MRRSLCLALCLTLCLPLFSFPALADSLPSRSTFSLAYDRLSFAIAKGYPIRFRVTVQPSPDADTGTDVSVSMPSEIEFSGIVACFSGGGWLDLTARLDGETVTSLGHLSRDGRVNLSAGNTWFTIADETGAQGASLLPLDALGQSLLSLDYSGLRAGELPFFSAFKKSAVRLWELASPWSENNNYLQVSSGPTSHGTTYKIPTEALRSILSSWAETLTRDGFSIAIPGTDFSFGFTEETFELFVGRLLQMAESIEATETLKFNLAFGEGDMLASARGNGTVRMNGVSKGVSYSYSASKNNTRISSKYNLDFQPKGPDTIAISGTTLRSSNAKDSAAHEITANASGLFNEKPYSFKLNSVMKNAYSVQNGELKESISGTVTCLLKYDGQNVADVSLTRHGDMISRDMRDELSIVDVYDIVIKNSERTLFSGTVTLALDIPEMLDQPPEIETAKSLKTMDFMDIEKLYSAIETMLDGARESLTALLPIRVASRSGN